MTPDQRQSPMLTIRKRDTDAHGIKILTPTVSIQIDDGPEFVCSPQELQRWCNNALGNPFAERVVHLAATSTQMPVITNVDGV